MYRDSTYLVLRLHLFNKMNYLIRVGIINFETFSKVSVLGNQSQKFHSNYYLPTNFFLIFFTITKL